MDQSYWDALALGLMIVESWIPKRATKDIRVPIWSSLSAGKETKGLLGSDLAGIHIRE